MQFSILQRALIMKDYGFEPYTREEIRAASKWVREQAATQGSTADPVVDQRDAQPVTAPPRPVVVRNTQIDGWMAAGTPSPSNLD